MGRPADHPRAAKVLATAVLALALTGCFYQASRIDEARAKAQAAYKACDQARQAGRFRNYRAAVECAVPKVDQAYTEAAYPYLDLIYIGIQARRIGAGKVDAGDITEAQYRHDLAELDTRIAAEEARRVEMTNRAATPTPTPVEVLIAGLPSFAPTPTAADQPQLPPRGSCLPLGGIKPCP